MLELISFASSTKKAARRPLIAVRSFRLSSVFVAVLALGGKLPRPSSQTLEEDTCQSDVHLSLNANPANLASLS